VINFFNTNGSVALGVEQITIDSETLLDPTLGRNLVDALNVGDRRSSSMVTLILKLPKRLIRISRFLMLPVWMPSSRLICQKQILLWT